MIDYENNSHRRVVVTGLGVVSSLGIGWKDFWKNITAGQTGISPISSFDTASYERHVAGEIKNFDASQFIERYKMRVFGRSTQMAIAASKLALEDAKLNRDDLHKRHAGICMGTTVGELRHLERYHDLQETHDEASHNDMIAAFPSSALSSNVAIELHLDGWNGVLATACAAGNYAIGEAYDLIKLGRADCLLAGGADSFSRVVFTGFARLFAIAPEKCQPFDRARQGMIPGEGAGILVLESLESAEKRGAPIYAEILGYGLSCDGNHMTIPSADGVAKAMRKSLKDANLDANEVDYICAHGTGTIENDRVECEAIRKVFGDRAKEMPTSSIKSMLGHTMGAASAIEAIACCLAIKEETLPPTINLSDPDPECDIDCVPNQSRRHRVRIALNNSQAFGGNNSCVVMGG